MEKLKMHSLDNVARNIELIGQFFPNAITEVIRDGKVVKAIDFEVLKQELSDSIVKGREERYQFTWPDKRKSMLLANTPITATLRPCREESVGKDGTPGGFDSENLYIEGDNLEVLKLLQETYLGKIKMIYIDPPYNTGNDFVYHDDFAENAQNYAVRSGQYDELGNRLISNTDTNGRFHTDWLNMIYPRLKIAKDLLRDDGVIFISIDDNELENLRKICDEIFGTTNFVTNLIWQSTAGSNTGTDIVTITEYIMVYTKNRNIFEFDGELVEGGKFTLCDEYENERGRYALDKLDRRRVGQHYSEALNYPIEMPDGQMRYPGGSSERSSEGWNYLWSKEKVKWGIRNGFIVFTRNGSGWNVYNKRYARVDNNGNSIERTVPFRNLITSDQCNTAQGTAELRALFGFRPFDFPKPSNLINYLLLTSVRRDKDALILDFFSGAATTAHAVMQLNAEDGGKRKFIMVQIPEKYAEDSEAYQAGYKNICEIGKERIRRAGRKIKEESPLTTADLDIGFRVLKLDSSNMEDVFYVPDDTPKDLLSLINNVKEDRTSEDLLFQVMLDLGIPLSSKIELTEIAGKKVYNVEDNYLLACFDPDITEDVVTIIAKKKPYYAVLKDSSMANDSVATNFEQIFVTYSPDTVCKKL